jgi:NTE family protein
MTATRRFLRRHSSIERVAALCLSIAAISCATTTTQLRPDQFPTAGGNGQGYRFEKLAGGKEENKLFVCLAFSGGGTRAAALAYGAMLALRQTHIDWPRQGETLLQEVDCISSVSGGSFPAAYYALHHDQIFEDFESRFLYRNIEGGLALKALSPWNWFWLASPYYSRIDLAADMYDDELFDHSSYNVLISQARRPFVIMNATNIGSGTRFPFTQDQFDLIGSDLGPYPVARAVAASSAFPFLLSPMTVENYQPLQGFPTLTEYQTGLQDYYNNRSRYYWAQSQLSYVDKPHPYVHLMDGGLADNIGLRPIINAYEQSNGFISRNIPDIARLVVIAVNARTESSDTISDNHHTPHIIPSVAMATATIAMDNYSFDTVDFADRLANDLKQAEAVSAQSGGKLKLHAPVPYVIELSFEAIPDPRVRREFYGIGTNFDLPSDQVKALINMGCVLLKNDPTFRCMLADIEREAAGHHDDASACNNRKKISVPLAAQQIVCPDAGPWPDN